MTLIKTPLQQLECHLKDIENRNDADLTRATIQYIKDLEYEIVDMKVSKHNYKNGIKDAAKHVRQIDIFDNQGIADSILELLHVHPESEGQNAKK